MSVITLAYPLRTNFLLERLFSKHPQGFCAPHVSVASLTSSCWQDHTQGLDLACPCVHMNLSGNKTFETNVAPLLPRIQNRILQQQGRWEIGGINLSRIYQRPLQRRFHLSEACLLWWGRECDAHSPNEKQCWEKTSIKWKQSRSRIKILL